MAPQLIWAVEVKVPRQVGIDGKRMRRISGRDEAALPQAQQVVQAHQAQHALVVDLPALTFELLGEASHTWSIIAKCHVRVVKTYSNQRLV